MKRTPMIALCLLLLTVSVGTSAVETPQCPAEYHPVETLRPAYPTNPVFRELEGWVLLEFRVLQDGSVESPKVVASSAKWFEQSAIAAMSKAVFPPQKAVCVQTFRVVYAVE